MPITLDGTNGITTPMYNGSITANAVTPSVNMKNRIINGNMTIDQRNAGASVTPTIDGQYTLDRWSAQLSSSSKFSVQQNAGSVTPPAGFTNYLGVTSLAATSLGTTDYYFITQKVEGYNAADLNWGTANAKTITLSFWVRSSLTGTFGAALTSTTDAWCPLGYTINSANTWEYKTITVVGPTIGTWSTTNGLGLAIRFSLGIGSTYSGGTSGTWTSTIYSQVSGSTSVVGTNGATFYITGVQLEVGSTATSFDYRPYGTELQLCQRYFELLYIRYTDFWNGTNSMRIPIPMKVEKRATPTGTLANGNWAGDQLNFAAASFLASYPSESALSVDGSGSGVMTRYSNSVAMSAEL